MTKLNSNPTQNMERDDFEQKLSEQPLRELPAQWRSRILSTAQAANSGSKTHSRADTPLFRMRDLRARFAALLWPTPRAWAGLALIWLLLAIANRIPLNHARSVAGTGSRPAPAAMAAWKEQERILVELIQLPEAPVHEAPRHALPQPRSEVLGPFRTI